MEGIRRDKLTTNHRGELGNDSNRSQHQPDKTRFVAQVVFSRIKGSIKHCVSGYYEGLRSLVDMTYGSGEPLIKRRIIQNEDTKKCYETTSGTYEDVRILPSLTNYQPVLPRPGGWLVGHDWTITCIDRATQHTHHSTR